MPDLTDSFCERCGTRYAFVADAPKGPSLKGARVLAKGLRNFVLTDGQSFSDSLEAARHEDSHESSTRITEAFRRTFSFCMQCRQYACGRCWNAGAGACLSCVPLAESEPPSMPAPAPSIATGPLAETAPPDVPTTPEQPQAAAEWPLFTEGPQPDPARLSAAREAPETPGMLASPDSASPRPAFSEWGAEPKLEPAASLAWPAADLEEVAAAAAASSNGKNGDGPAHRQADREAASQWPIADQIAPAMALTAEEFAIIQAQLSQTAPVVRDPLDTRPGAVRQVEAAPSAEVPPQAETAPSVEAGRQVEAVPLLLAHTPAEGSAAWILDSAWARGDEIVSGPSPEPAAAELGLADGPESIEADAALPAEPIAEAEAPTLSPHLLRRTLIATVLPPLASMTPRPTVSEPSGLVARLLGRRTSDEEVGAAPRGPSRKGGSAAGPWPHATRWSERPTEGRHWWTKTETPRPAMWTSETPIQDVTPEYIEAPAPAGTVPLTAEARAAVPSEPTPTSRSEPIAPTTPVAPAVAHADLDSCSAAPMRLSADESAASYLAPDLEPVETFTPAEQVTPDLEAAPAMPVAQPAAAAPATPQAVPARPQRLAPEAPAAPPATAWPPLGARWPSRKDPTSPWPAPDAPAVPAIVAAAQIPTPTIAEMWAQSSQEVVNRGSVRVCGSCALPVSTQARFCRRCGSPQG